MPYFPYAQQEKPQNALVMVCTCTFLARHWETLLGHCPSCTSSIESMLPYGSGFRSKPGKKKNGVREKGCFRICCGWDHCQNRLGTCLDRGSIEPKGRVTLALGISKERDMIIAEKFLSGLVKVHGKRPVSTDGDTWYPQACEFWNWSIICILTWEKLDWTGHAVHQGQDRRIWRLFSMPEGKTQPSPCQKLAQPICNSA